ncbi:MAG: magnesium transporter, partial [Flavobacteriales bacterium]|nr:magnesium transporter [Flavobacteriales bacterium]
MSENNELNRELLENLSSLIKGKSSGKIKDIICDLHIADVAEIIEEFSIEQANFIFQLMDEEKSALVLMELEEDTRENLLSFLSAKEIATEVIENLESDDATDVISELPEEQKEEVLSLIEDDEHASDIEDLLNYEEDTAGGLMAKELIKVNENWTTLRCLKEMRKQATQVRKVHSIYVVNEEDKLVGTLSLRKLLLTESRINISEITNYEIISVLASVDDEE